MARARDIKNMVFPFKTIALDVVSKFFLCVRKFHRLIEQARPLSKINLWKTFGWWKFPNSSDGMQRFWLFWVSGANYWELARSDTLPSSLASAGKTFAAMAETEKDTKSARRSTAQSQKLPKRILPWFIIHNRGKNEHFGFLKAQNFSGSFPLKTEKKTDLYVKNLWSKNRWKVYYENMGRNIHFSKAWLENHFPLSLRIKSNESDTKKLRWGLFGEFLSMSLQTRADCGWERWDTKKLLDGEQKKSFVRNCRWKLNQFGKFSWTRACRCNSESFLNIYFSCLFPDQT